MKIKEPKNRIKLPEELLTEKDISKLIEAADNPRDRAFIALIGETGFRIGEMFSICMKSISVEEKGIRVHITVKKLYKGSRRSY